MKRITSLIAVVAFASSLATPCWSQGSPGVPAAPGSCHEKGRAEGQAYPTGGAFTVGLVSGALAGLIGTGVAYAFQGEPAAPEATVGAIPDGTCRIEYRDAYAKAGRAKKRKAALTGGLLGTGIAVVAIVAAGSN